MGTQHKSQLRLHPKLRTRMTGWSIPVWMVNAINQIAEKEQESASMIVRGFIANEMSNRGITSQDFMSEMPNPIDTHVLLEERFDPAKRSALATWSLPLWMVTYVKHKAEEKGVMLSTVARELMEDAILRQIQDESIEQKNTESN